MRLLFIFLILTLNLSTSAQVGGRYAFESIALPSNARLTALGGSLISVQDEDVALAHQNPALITAAMSHQLALNQNFYFSGISHGYVGYGLSFDSLDLHGHIALQYLDYGQFDLSDEIGNINGSFSGNDIAVIAGVSKQLNERIHVGVNMKFIHSSLESYRAQAMGADLGVLYQKPGASYAWGLVLKNIGFQFSAFANEKKPLPFDFQIGYSRRLAHLPFRFSIIGQRLYKWDVRYEDPDSAPTSNFLGNDDAQSGFSRGVDNFFRHLIFNGAFLIGRAEQFRVRFGFNHFRRKELSVSAFRSLSGFSAGIGFNIKKIKIDYGIGFYHLAGATNHLSLRLDMGRIFTKT